MSVEITVARARTHVTRAWTARIAVAVVLIIFPFIAPSNLVSVGFVALQYALLALGLNIIVGWVGLLDLGAAGFVGIGAYTTAILMTRFGVTPVAVLPLVLACGVAAGIVLGIPTLRHRADYFALLTLGFAELVALILRNWTAVTGGSFGYSGIPATRIPFLSQPIRALPPIGFYYLALAVVLPSYLFVIWLRSTALARRFHVVKHSEDVGQVYGVNILGVKLSAFAISAGLLSLGGFFWATYQRSIIWTEFNILLSCLLLSVVIVGGVGNPDGIVLGAAIIGSSLELLRRLLTNLGLPQNIRFFIFASVLIAVVHFRQSGILPNRPTWVPRLRRMRHGRPANSSSATQENSETGNTLEVSGLVKSFGGIRALDDIRLSIPAGSSVALIGPNGSGKTTLLNVISGLIRADRGVIRVTGSRLNSLRPFSLAHNGVARSFQEVSVFDDLSAEDNVYVTAGAVSADQIDAALARFGIHGSKTPVAALPYGEKKALDLARLLVDPDRVRLLLLDEPTAGLNPREAMKIVESLVALRDKQRFALLVVTHDIQFLEALNVDRIVVMHQGRIFKEGPYAQIRRDPDVRKLFWGDE